MLAPDERLKVLLLRALGLSQDEVAGLLRCAKQSVGDVERWFKEDPQGEGMALLDNQRIRRLVGRDFPDLELEPSYLIRAGQITADDILLHYDKAGRTSDVRERRSVDPLYARRLEEHWAKLRELTVALREQLSPLPVRILFSAEVSQSVHAAAESGEPPFQGDRWRQVFNAPVEIRSVAGGGEAAIEARLLAQGEFLFPHLISHMKAEFSEFGSLDEWQSRLGEVLGACLDRSRDVTSSCSTAAGLPYLRAETQEWLSYQFPAYLCQVVMQTLGRETAPELVTEVQADGSWRLRPKDYPAIALAGGSATADARCREAFAGEIARNAGITAWRDVATGLATLEADAAPLRMLLTTVIERGDFRGTCALCEAYLSPSRNS